MATRIQKRIAKTAATASTAGADPAGGGSFVFTDGAGAIFKVRVTRYG